MATIEKHGNSYKITILSGYDANKKKRWESKTWTPPAGLAPDQIEVELKKAVYAFEKEVESRQAMLMKIFTQETELLGKIDKLIEYQKWISRLLLSINTNIETMHNVSQTIHPKTNDDSISDTTKPFYLSWSEAPQIMGVKEVSKMINMSEDHVRALMHSRDFPLIELRNGFSRLQVDKDKLRAWLRTYGEKE